MPKFNPKALTDRTISGNDSFNGPPFLPKASTRSWVADPTWILFQENRFQFRNLLGRYFGLDLLNFRNAIFLTSFVSYRCFSHWSKSSLWCHYFGINILPFHWGFMKPMVQPRVSLLFWISRNNNFIGVVGFTTICQSKDSSSNHSAEHGL